jgi:FtsP/CotA-like multicopper oxidase with cupredoxin domain
MPDVVEVREGFTITYYDDGSTSGVVPSRDPREALLMGPAERPDTIVDFAEVLAAYPTAVAVRMLNTAPDAPFGGDYSEPAMPDTTGQVMQFNLNLPLSGNDQSTHPLDLVLLDQTAGTPAASRVRDIALLEEGSGLICVAVDGDGEFLVPIQQVAGDPAVDCADAGVDAAAFGPQAAVLGTVDNLGNPAAQLWADPIEQNPAVGDTEEWKFWNFSADAHPIHVHLVGFEVLGRQELLLNADGEAEIPGVPVAGTETPALPWETGFKDTVTALPGEITSIKATFDLPGLYVWHCHILSHEDNEMMVPYCIGDEADGVCSGAPVAPGA